MSFDNPYNTCALCDHLDECVTGEDGETYGHACLEFLPDHKDHYMTMAETSEDCPVCKLQFELGYKKPAEATA